MKFEFVAFRPDEVIIFHFFIPGMMGTASFDLRTSHIRILMSSAVFPYLVLPVEGIVLGCM